MSDACCGGDASPATTAPRAARPAEPVRLWQVGELRFAAVAAPLLLAGYAADWLGAPGPLPLLLKTAALLVAGWTFVPPTLRRLFRRGAGRDRIGVGTLMTLAAAGAVALGEVGEAAALAVLFTVAEGLEGYAVARTRRGLRALLDLVPARATVLRDGTEHSVAPEELRPGQTLVLRPGERLATDGVVASGHTSLDTSAITGESVPVEKAANLVLSAETGISDQKNMAFATTLVTYGRATGVETKDGRIDALKLLREVQPAGA